MVFTRIYQFVSRGRKWWKTKWNVYAYYLLSNSYMELGENIKALFYFFKALQIQNQISKENIWDYFINMNLFRAYFLQFRVLFKWHSIFEQNLKVYIESYGDNHLFVAHAYNNLGICIQWFRKYIISSSISWESIIYPNKIIWR